VFHVDSVATALSQLQALHVQPKSIGKDDQGNPISIMLGMDLHGSCMALREQTIKAQAFMEFAPRLMPEHAGFSK
jgi:hypothetical protein